MNWPGFWKQYYIPIHSKNQLTNAEKLVYLWQSLKDVQVENVIEGLSGSGSGCVVEAMKCLQKRYDKLCLQHQWHVMTIVEVPGWKDSNGKELDAFMTSAASTCKL